MIKNDKWIKRMSVKERMIEPFEEKQVRRSVVSYGLGSYGYDVRLADEFKVISAENVSLIDPKNFRKNSFVDVKDKHCIIPPHSYVLGRSFEYFRIPQKVLTLCFGKSTYARCGIIVNITPLEPEWEGYITIAISNTAPVPAKIHSHEGIAQLVFFEADEPPSFTYKDKKGKYQAQKEITISRI